MVIPWVKVKSKKEGTETIYKSSEVSVRDSLLRSGMMRRMDCIDCHNRPSHIYNPPMRSVNHLMSIGRIDPDLPYIKSLSVQVLEKNYNSKEEALSNISYFLKDFYRSNYAGISSEKKDKINNAIKEIQGIYLRNYFPYMRVSWRKFPEQIGHMYAPGCFRCHDGKHVSEEGKVISKDCNVCHTLLAQEFENKETEFSLKGVEYKHPVEIGRAWEEIGCSSCHLAKK
jgi:hypothetical protein